MLKSFSFNIILLLGINLIIKPIYIFGVDAQVQNILGESVYGTYFGLFSFCYLFQFILDPGLQNYNITTVSKNPGLFYSQFPKIILTKLLFSLLFAACILIGAKVIGYSQENIHLLTKIISLQILISFAFTIRTNLSALGAYWKDSLLSALDKLVLICIVFYLFYALDQSAAFSIHDWIEYQLIAFSIVIFISLLLLFPFIKKIELNGVFDGILKLVKSAFPFALVFLLMILYTKMDGVMLERLLNDNGKEAGIYAAGYRLFEAGNMFAFLFASLLLPMFSANINSIAKIESLCESALRMILPFSIIALITAIFFGEEIMTLIYTQGDGYYGQVFAILMASFFMLSLSYIYGTLITATSKLKWLNISFGVGILINWTLNYILIQSYGALGAAIATLITQTFIIVSQLIIVNTLMPLQFNKSLVFRTVLTTFATIIIFNSSDLITFFHWSITCALCIFLSLLVSFLVGLLRFDIARLAQQRV